MTAPTPEVTQVGLWIKRVVVALFARGGGSASFCCGRLNSTLHVLSATFILSKKSRILEANSRQNLGKISAKIG